MIVVCNNNFTSSILRGEHIAEALKVRCHFADIGGQRGDVVLFVKESDRGLVEDAKERNNMVIYDPLDWFCYRDRTVDFGELVDVVIVYNQPSVEFYAPIFPKARFALIPHQWDYRITGTAPQDYFRPAYIGKGFNKPEFWKGMAVCNSAQFLQAAPLFNFHLALQKRDAKSALLKPNTKVSIAAAVGANTVTYPDPGAVELLGEDYPYYAGENPQETIKKAQREFGSSWWRQARERMRQVRERTSLQAVAALYRRLADRDLGWLLDPIKAANRIPA